MQAVIQPGGAVRDGPARSCSGCGKPLSRYNPEPRCGPCTRAAVTAIATTPAALPEDVWNDDVVVSSMTNGDFGTAFRRIRQMAALRQEDMAHITGLSQSFLSSLAAGSRRLVNIDKIMPVLERIAVPDHALPRVFARSSEPAGSHPSTGVAEALDAVWESPLDIAKRLNVTTSSNTDPAALLLLEQQITDIVDRYELQGPHQLAPTTTVLRGFIQGLLEGHQPPDQRRTLFRLAAQASGLLGYMAVNAGREASAEAYCTEAFELASQIGDQDLMMWAFGTRSLSAYYAGRYQDALQWADAGIDLDPTHPQAIRLLSNGRARALGKLGDITGAERALAAAGELSGRHELADGLTACISFEPYGMARTLANAATAYVALGDTRQVIAHADQIDELVEQSDSAWSQALVRLDVATALLTGPHPDVDHAMVLGRQVLDSGGGPPIRSVVQRAGELQAHAAQWQHLPAVRDYSEALHQWRSAPITRTVVESAKMTAATERTRARGTAGAPHRQQQRLPSRPTRQHR